MTLGKRSYCPGECRGRTARCPHDCPFEVDFDTAMVYKYKIIYGLYFNKILESYRLSVDTGSD